LTSRDSCYQSFVRSRERLGTRCAIASLRRAYPATPYEVVELASFKHTLEMAVKTKRSSVRTALLATASLALVRGAQADFPAFADSYPSGTDDAYMCLALRFHAETGVLIDPADSTAYDSGVQGAHPEHNVLERPAGFADCKVHHGYYLEVVAAGDNDGTNLVVKKVPANFFSPYRASYFEAYLYASPSEKTWDGQSADLTNTGVYKCPANSNSLAGSDQLADCVTDAGYLVQTGHASEVDSVVLVEVPQGAGFYAAGGQAVADTTNQVNAMSSSFKADLTTQPSPDDLAKLESITGVAVCPFGGVTSVAGGSAVTDCDPNCGNAAFEVDGTTGNCHCAAGYYGAANPTTTDGTGCDACPFGGSSDVGSTLLTDCAPNCGNAAFEVDGTTGNCHCTAGYYGTADGTTTDGTGCDACPTATTSTAGAGADSECNIIVCEDIPLNGVTDATTGGAVESSGATNTGTADFSICETAPGYYLYSVASAATAAAGIRIEKAPEGWYAPGGEDVTDGNVLAVAEDALDETASGAGTQAYDDAQIFLCPTNSNSEAGSGDLEDCKCAANFYPSSDTCVACASGTTRAGTVSVTGTATCSAAASPTAYSACASTPIAVALVTAAAVPLLL